MRLGEATGLSGGGVAWMVAGSSMALTSCQHQAPGTEYTKTLILRNVTRVIGRRLPYMAVDFAERFEALGAKGL